MSEKKVKFAVVGLRSIGNAYVVNAIQKIPEAELVAICEVNEEIGEKRAKEYGLEKFYTDFYEMIKDGGFDADNVSFCGSKSETGTNGAPSTTASTAAPSFSNGGLDDFAAMADDDDLPF